MSRSPILRGVSAVPRRFPVWFPALLAALLVAADQLLKAWALANLQQDGNLIRVIPGLLDWTLTFNTGAAWSMFSGSAGILAFGRLLVGLGILAYLVLRPQNRFLSVILSMIAAGAIGNAIDGILRGRVTDMIHAPFLSAVTRMINGQPFPIFNIADSCVVIGTILLLVASFLPQKKPAGENDELTTK